MPGAIRSDEVAVRAGLDAWLAGWPTAQASGARVQACDRPATGWSGDVLLVRLDRPVPSGADRLVDLVVRVAAPPERASFPEPTFAAQEASMGVARAAGLAVPRVLANEVDESFLGAPFLVMTRAAGRTVGDAPALDPWLVAQPPATQRRVQDGHLAALARLHRIDPRIGGLPDVLRGDSGAGGTGSGEGLAREVDWWSAYAEWAADGEVAPTLASQLQWCAATAPGHRDPPSLLWGDARLGNLLLRDDGTIAAMLDWELASIGPPELDLGWLLALDALTARVVGAMVPGFVDRSAVIEHYEHGLGRPVEHLRWHEIFALVRSVAVNDRQARLAARFGVPYPGVAGEDNPMLGYIARRIDRFEAAP